MNRKDVRYNPVMLIALAKAGDKEAFGLLYQIYFLPVFRYVYLRTKSKMEAEDLTQEIFLKAFEAIKNFEERGKPPLSYFFTIARNKVIDYWRMKKKILIEDEDRLALVGEAEPNNLIEKEDTKTFVREMIKNLTPEQQDVIILKFINDFSNREIADLLGKSEEAIRQLQCRALRVLRQKFKDFNWQ